MELCFSRCHLPLLARYELRTPALRRSSEIGWLQPNLWRSGWTQHIMHICPVLPVLTAELSDHYALHICLGTTLSAQAGRLCRTLSRHAQVGCLCILLSYPPCSSLRNLTPQQDVSQKVASGHSGPDGLGLRSGGRFQRRLCEQSPHRSSAVCLPLAFPDSSIR
jgi:hypothetical protein